MSYRFEGNRFANPSPEDVLRQKLQAGEHPEKRVDSDFKNNYSSRPSSSGRSADPFGSSSFSPRSGRSGEDLLSRFNRDLNMFSHSPDWGTDPQRFMTEDADDWARRNLEGMRNRNPMFRMPNWMSDEDDISPLSSRMSHAPHFASMGHRMDPWVQRTGSGSPMRGDSADSTDGTNTNRTDSTPINIPIRIEAEAPAGWVPPQPSQDSSNNQPDSPAEPRMGQEPYRSATVGDVSENVQREARSSSAPPEMRDPKMNKFVTKVTLSPQNSNNKNSISQRSKFNNFPKPFVPPKPQLNSTIPEEQKHQGVYSDDTKYHQDEVQRSPPPSHQHRKTESSSSGGVRTIPIMIEGRSNTPNASPRSGHNHSQQTKDTEESPHGTIPLGFYPLNDPANPPSTFQQPPQHEEQPDTHEVEENADVKMELIYRVREYFNEIEEKVKNFKGCGKDREYIYLDEMLTRALLRLDDIDPDGRKDVRQMRRELIRDINATIALLEKIAKDNKMAHDNADKMADEIQTESVTNGLHAEGHVDENDNEALSKITSSPAEGVVMKDPALQDDSETGNTEIANGQQLEMTAL